MTLSCERSYPVAGAGLGLRNEFFQDYLESPAPEAAFLEAAPENWMGVGGPRGRRFCAYTERFPFVFHGLSLSIGGPQPLDDAFLHELKQFLDRHQARCYTEHLSYTGDDGQLYDLMPIPFTAEAVRYVAARIAHVQDVLERRIGMENVSYYAAPGQDMAEIDFFNAVIEAADCDVHLDVNNIYVNSINHGYDPYDFLSRIPGERIAYCHIAGHYVEAEDLRIDTHGADVIDPVWSLLDAAYDRFGVLPTLLERDFNIPPLTALRAELRRIQRAQAAAARRRSRAVGRVA